MMKLSIIWDTALYRAGPAGSFMRRSIDMRSFEVILHQSRD